MSEIDLRCRLNGRYGANNIDRLPESLFKRAMAACLDDIAASDVLISNYIETKRNQPAFFTSMENNQFTEEIFGRIFSTVAAKSETGQVIISCKSGEWKPSVVKLVDLLASVNLTLQCLSLDESKVTSGLTFLVDAEGMGLAHIQAVKPFVMQNFFKFMFNSSPAGIKYIIVYNSNWAVNLIYGACKPFLPKSITDRIIVMAHDDEKLATYLGENLVRERRHLPNQDEIDEFIKEIESKRKIIIEEWEILDEIVKATAKK